MGILWAFAFLNGIALLVYGLKFLIDEAWQRQGKWLVAVETVNAICILTAGSAIIVLLIAGLEQVYYHYSYALLVSGGALAYTIYFYVTRNEARTKARTKAQLTPKQADEIINRYGVALEYGLRAGDAIRITSLPCSKERVKQAVKVALAFQIKHNSLKEEDLSNLVVGLMNLGRFVPNEQADRVNSGPRSLSNPDFRNFRWERQGLEINAEMDEFVAKVSALDPIDPLYYQKVYTLIGLPYSPSLDAKWERDYFDALS